MKLNAQAPANSTLYLELDQLLLILVFMSLIHFLSK